MSLIEVFQQPKWRFTRAGLFVGLGLWGAVPLVHSTLVHGGVAAVADATRLDALMGVLYLVSRLPHWCVCFTCWSCKAGKDCVSCRVCDKCVQ